MHRDKRLDVIRRVIGAGVILCALTCASCTHQVQVSSSPTAVPVPATRAVPARQAGNAQNAGDGDIELRTLRQRLAANPKDLDVRMLLARRYADRGFTDLALEHYRFAAAQFPESVPVALALAKALHDMGAPEPALNGLREFSDRHPGGSWEALSLAGIIEDEQGRLSAAETAHRAAVALAPGRSDLHNNLGYNLLQQGKLDGAIAEFRRAVEIDPKSEIAHNNLAAALAAQPGPASAEALAEWRRSAGEAEAHNNLGAALIQQGRYPEARAEILAALGYQPGLPAAIANLKLLAEKDGQAAVASAPARPKVSIWTKLFGEVPGSSHGPAEQNTKAATTSVGAASPAVATQAGAPAVTQPAAPSGDSSVKK